MKFFVFTCLLAVAFAKQMEDSSSSEEFVNIAQEETTRNINQREHTSVSSSEESAEVPTENKINQFYQKLMFLQYLQALRQPQIVINPLDQVKTSAYPFFPIVNREQLFTSEETPDTTDMGSTEVFTQKNKLTEERKNHLKLLNKVAQYYQKFPVPQYFKTVHQYQTAMKPWNHIKTNAYQIIPTLV